MASSSAASSSICRVGVVTLGARIAFGHGLAAAYIGFSIAFGHSIVRWADERFAHRFAGGPSPSRSPRHGWARVRYLWRDFGQALLAWLISYALLAGAIMVVNDAARTEALEGWIGRLTAILVIWALWPVTSTVGEAGRALHRLGARVARAGADTQPRSSAEEKVRLRCRIE